MLGDAESERHNPGSNDMATFSINLSVFFTSVRSSEYIDHLSSPTGFWDVATYRKVAFEEMLHVFPPKHG